MATGYFGFDNYGKPLIYGDDMPLVPAGDTTIVEGGPPVAMQRSYAPATNSACQSSPHASFQSHGLSELDFGEPPCQRSYFGSEY